MFIQRFLRVRTDLPPLSWTIYSLGLLLIIVASPTLPQEAASDTMVSQISHPEWSYNASIYEVNLRQYTPEGTFNDFSEHLPRLKKMGVKILWFMPIHPIGEKNRKGTLGSYYAVKDYLAVNKEFGTLEDFKKLVKKIHEMGMYVLIDWVANHTAWDNPLTVKHPEWYTKDEAGNFVPPVADWHDVIDLNYDNPDLREYMIDALKFWVEETNIDGYRCDVAGMVPIDFWNRAREELDKIKPVFMLAEWESPEMHENAFHMTYSWSFYHLLNAIARGDTMVTAIDSLWQKERATYPRDAFRMRFTSNHDENSWNGTVFERLGDGVEAFAVLATTVKGLPLIYSGQEAGLNERLAFFEKDTIQWKVHKLTDVYTTLLHLKKSNRALHNGNRGGVMQRIHTSEDEAIYAFIRESGSAKVVVILNLTDTRQEFVLEGETFAGEYTDVFRKTSQTLSTEQELTLRAWDYLVLAR